MSRAAVNREAAGQRLQSLIKLCQDVAEGWPVSSEHLFTLAAMEQGTNVPRRASSSDPQEQLAQAVAMMLLRVESRQEALRHRMREQEAEMACLEARNRSLAATVQDMYQSGTVIGQSPRFKDTLRLALGVAAQSVNAVIRGPSGSGRDFFARLMHYRSPRREGPFVRLDCATLPRPEPGFGETPGPEYSEAVLGGPALVPGTRAAVTVMEEMVARAAGGTLYLDRISCLPPAAQATLVRLIAAEEHARQAKEGRGEASVVVLSTGARILASADQDLTEALNRGAFRADLFYRINVAELPLPSLAERGDDVLLLARAFLSRAVTQWGRPALIWSPEVEQALQAYGWPGNVRELEDVMHRAAALAMGPTLTLDDLPPALRPPRQASAQASAASKAPHSPERLSERVWDLDSMEKAWILDALHATGWNKSHAAELLGISRQGLRKKLQRYGIEPLSGDNGDLSGSE